MVVSLKKHFAAEKKSLQSCIKEYSKKAEGVKKLIKRLNKKIPLAVDSKILEIGSAQGSAMITLKKLGYKTYGVEPCDKAIKTSLMLQKELNCVLDIKKGFAENIPFEGEQFDLVIASSVMEHVKDVKKVFGEAYRVLKENGGFYFSTTSCLCPKQSEIRFFPFFSWYPTALKIKIIDWSIKNMPALVGYSDTPAFNWFTPWGVNSLLRQAGFKNIYDRWDLFLEENISSRLKRTILKVIRLNKSLKFFANVIKPASSYLAIKGEKY
ncbi:MAG: methyltransferase domain-containing protein [Candidatus Omnitrophica bacterium]|nr:methyltransferase domain-containing protein [Candidatus Omnitrophota bacterium]